MNDILTMAEISERFPSEWVLLANPQTNDHLAVLAGTLVCHSKNRDEVDRKAIELPSPKHIAVFYTGPVVPEGMELLL
jgi:hypothetical protein